MALVSLKNRVARLDAKHRMESGKVVGIIGGTPEPYVEDVGGVLYLRFPETPTGEPFEVVALRQQRALQDELSALELTDAPPTKLQAPRNVGNEIAPLKPGKKQRNFVEVEGIGEIEIATFKGFAR